ncbi:hypothetical protein [Streptomyces apocyni]|uniref:hypothetical protein n=1 Tax=Streptomyces apocyni TaxID=2654677 RepID=UPI0012EAE53B|nr:hypothetical protein [Streptomyces apocyni]
MPAPHARDTRTGLGLRLLRAAVFAAVCVALSAGGHTLASHARVPMWTFCVGFAAVFAVAAPLAGRARALPGIAAALAVGQLGLHTLFGAGQQHTAQTATQAAATADATLIERAARLVCGASTAALSPTQAYQILVTARLEPSGGAHAHPLAADPASSAAGPYAGASAWPLAYLPDLPMLLGHLLAALAAGWLLRRGDLALLRVSQLALYGVAEGALVRSLRAALALVRALTAGLPGVPEPGPRTPRTVLLAPPGPRTTTLQHTVTRRGPPPAELDLAA